MPTVCVGNLAVGGTGKTPHVMMIAEALCDNLKVGVLSRGYKRKTKGFRLVGPDDTALTVGDEPLEIYRRVGEKVMVAVAENRVRGIKKMLEAEPELDVVLLDDGFQHRRLSCGLYILLTAADNIYTNDRLLPWGSLRENRWGALRANMIVVSKCADDMRPIDKRIIETSLHLPTYQNLYFSYIEYDDIPDTVNPLLLTGIADAEPLANYLKKRYPQLVEFRRGDHHRYTRRDMDKLLSLYQTKHCDAVLTTRKDMMRLEADRILPEQLKDKVHAVNFKVTFKQQEQSFINQIIQYVKENNRNC